jgi:6-phosphogluconolactonase
VRISNLLVLLGLVIIPTAVSAAEPVVFISAFASGEEGAIHAFSFDETAGRLKPLNRTTDVESPFFLALSPSLLD